MTFNMVETLVGGLSAGTVDEAMEMDRGLRRDAAQANPQLANFERDHLPGLEETVSDFMASVEGRHWLWQYSMGVTSLDVILERFGQDIAEAFQLWVAMQEDTDKLVRNAANGVAWNSAGDRASSTGSFTMAVERPEQAAEDGGSQDGPDVARVDGGHDAGEDQDTQQNTQGDLDMRSMDCDDDNRGGGCGANSDFQDVLLSGSALHVGEAQYEGEGDSELPVSGGRDAALLDSLPGDAALHEGEGHHALEEGSGLLEAEGQDGHSALCEWDG